MNRRKRVWSRWAFLVGFVILTSLCWCPWAYGTLRGKALDIPIWAVLAYVFAAALFVLEWVFLFLSGLAVTDEDLRRISGELESMDSDDSSAEKGGE